MDRAAGGNVLQCGVAGRYDKAARKDEAVKKARDEMEKRRKQAGGASPQVCQLCPFLEQPERDSYSDSSMVLQEQ